MRFIPYSLIFFLSGSLLLNAQTCPSEACTEPVTSVEICPDFCNLEDPYVITGGSTTFNCSLYFNNECVEYTPLPGLLGGFSDDITLTACTADGTCQSIEVLVSIMDDCDSQPLGELECGDLCSLEWLDLAALPTNSLAVVEYNGSEHIFFYWDPVPPDGMDSLFDCEGNNICNFGGIAGLNGEGCPGFDPTAVTPFENLPEVDDCFNECNIDPEATCITLYDPVCGCDGNTYSNDCVAQISGVLSWTAGECDNCQYPALNPDNYTLFENQDSCLYVRNNDFLLQDIALTYSLVTQPTSGNISDYNLMEGCFEYEATPGFTGNTSFEYMVCYLDFPCNGLPSSCSTETVTLEILADTTNAISDAPLQILRVVPNPAQTSIQFENTDLEMDRIDIIDLSGKVIQTFNAAQLGTTTISVAHLANGVYLLNAYGGKRRFTGRFEKVN